MQHCKHTSWCFELGSRVKEPKQEAGLWWGEIVGQKGHVKWGIMAVSCLPYRTPDQKLETCLRKEENRILVLLFYVSLFVIQSNLLGVIFKVLTAEILLQIKSYTGTSYTTQMRVELSQQVGRCRWAWWVHPGLILPAWLLSNHGALWDTAPLSRTSISMHWKNSVVSDEKARCWLY